MELSDTAELGGVGSGWTASQESVTRPWVVIMVCAMDPGWQLKSPACYENGSELEGTAIATVPRWEEARSNFAMSQA